MWGSRGCWLPRKASRKRQGGDSLKRPSNMEYATSGESNSRKFQWNEIDFIVGKAKALWDQKLCHNGDKEDNSL